MLYVLLLLHVAKKDQHLWLSKLNTMLAPATCKCHMCSTLNTNLNAHDLQIVR